MYYSESSNSLTQTILYWSGSFFMSDTVPITESEVEWFSPKARSVASFFDIDNIADWDYYRPKIQSVLSWAKQKTKSDQQDDWLYEIKRVQRSIGKKPSVKQNVAELYQYATLDSENSSLRTKLGLLTNEKPTSDQPVKKQASTAPATHIEKTVEKQSQQIGKRVEGAISIVIRKSIQSGIEQGISSAFKNIRI